MIFFGDIRNEIMSGSAVLKVLVACQPRELSVHRVSKKRGVELFAIFHQLLTDFKLLCFTQ